MCKLWSSAPTSMFVLRISQYASMSCTVIVQHFHIPLRINKKAGRKEHMHDRIHTAHTYRPVIYFRLFNCSGCSSAQLSSDCLSITDKKEYLRRELLRRRHRRQVLRNQTMRTPCRSDAHHALQAGCCRGLQRLPCSLMLRKDRNLR